MMYACVKTWNTPIVPMIRLKKMYGVSIGSVTWRNRLSRPAPSIAAASYSSSGMLLRPASQISMLAPAPQRLMIIRAGLARLSCWSHFNGTSRPQSRTT